jgi:hypothetical protein
MTAPGDFSSGDVLTAADMNDLPAGKVADDAKTSDTAISSASLATVNTVTFTAESGRQYLVMSTWWCDNLSTTLYVRNALYIGGSRFQETNAYGTSTLDRVNLTTFGTFQGTGASVTVTSQAATNTGTATVLGGGGRPALLVVMDIGPV